MLGLRNRQKGDTLIEVLFAVTVFSLVIVLSLSLMNRGASTSQRSLEISLVSQQIDNQAETLRYLHEAYVTNYQVGYESSPNITNLTGATKEFYTIVQLIKSTGATQASQFGNVDTCPNPPTGSFILNTHTGAVVSNTAIFKKATTYSQLVFDSANLKTMNSADGIWIQGIKSATTTGTQAGTGYIDFHIRACWNSTGSSKPITLGTIVRLYEPRS